MSLLPNSCWQTCFQGVQSPLTNKDTVKDVYRAGKTLMNKANQLGITDVAFILDATLDNGCFMTESKIEKPTFQISYSQVQQMFSFQLQLMTIFSMMIGNIRSYPVQFSDSGAWACDEFEGMNNCQQWTLSTGNYLRQFQSNQSTCSKGMIEPACRIASNYLDSFMVANTSRMAVALFHHGVQSDFEDDLTSICRSKFSSRFGIGLFDALERDYERFGSKAGLHARVRANGNAFDTVSALHTCITSSCCAFPVAVNPTSRCVMSSGEAGEAMLPFQITTS